MEVAGAIQTDIKLSLYTHTHTHTHTHTQRDCIWLISFWNNFKVNFYIFKIKNVRKHAHSWFLSFKPEDEIEVSTSIEPEKKRRRLFRMLSLNKVIIECSSSRFINSNITTILRELYFWLSRQALYSIFLL